MVCLQVPTEHAHSCALLLERSLDVIKEGFEGIEHTADCEHVEVSSALLSMILHHKKCRVDTGGENPSIENMDVSRLCTELDAAGENVNGTPRDTCLSFESTVVCESESTST